MINFIKKFFTENIGLKLIALILAFMLWFYVVSELRKGSEEENQFLDKVFPRQQVAAKKLSIKPIFVGRLRSGYEIAGNKVVTVPDYCIVVGTKDILEKIKFIYTMPVDLGGASKSFTKSVALNPIAPGIYMEETFVEVTVPVEKAATH